MAKAATTKRQKAQPVAPTTTGTKAKTFADAAASVNPDPPADAHPEVQAKVGAATDQGFSGVEVDSTPNENYTVAGVLAGKPTPETTREPGTRVPVHALVDGKVVQR